MGRTPVTATTAVAVVNGHELSYRDYLARVQSEIQNAQQREGRTLSQDDTRRIENAVFDQMVSEVLLQDEYRRRGISVSDDEVREFARYAPPPWITGAPELQTDGRFDPEKYQRLLASPQARQSGLLLQLEAYYRGEIPREKLLDQIASGAYASDEELWRAWRDQHDSAQASFVAFSPAVDTNMVKAITDAELRSYFDQHSGDFEAPGRAVLSVVTIPRMIGPADSAAAKTKAQQLREEIVKGAKFEDVAKRESADTVSGAKGGDLGPAPKTRYVAEFSKAADALKVGEVSQPVLTQFGYHIIRLDSRKGDTLSLHHILLRVTQSDSAATRIDREADALSRLAAQSEQGSKLDSAAKQLKLPVYHIQALEDSPAVLGGQVVPSVSAWAFGGGEEWRDQRIIRRRERLLYRATGHTPGRWRAEVRECERRGSAARGRDQGDRPGPAEGAKALDRCGRKQSRSSRAEQRREGPAVVDVCSGGRWFRVWVNSTRRSARRSSYRWAPSASR
jgi:peptidyl-prolyl cis-trans isomerase D